MTASSELGRAPPLSVSALTHLITHALYNLGSVAVIGELSQVKVAASGHLYGTLKDEQAVLNIVIWRSQLARLGRIPQEGSRVIVHGQLDVYPARGSYQLIVQRLLPAGAGELAARLEQLKQRLAAEGLFAEERKRPLPFLPRAVGLATAANSAALADLLEGIRRRFPTMPVVLAPCLVQGEGAAASIVAALQRLAAHPEVDVIVCGRGGGSLEDLWAFNEEPVVRAIAGCPKPVVSAVGHETDWTLADLAADVRAKTPTAAGELVVPVLADLLAALAERRQRLQAAIDRSLSEAQARLAALAAHRALQSPHYQVALRQQRLDELAGQLEATWQRRWTAANAELVTLSARLHALSPLAVLARGYAIARRSHAGVLRRVADAPLSTTIEVRLRDGWLEAQVTGHRPLSAWEAQLSAAGEHDAEP
ncbi:MAG: exodeoxyribonuclease VII large subunit [Planctomycetota bacterium]|nr:exodeoxyribonuclease VII large subunit [Planctomycetota bacterium]